MSVFEIILLIIFIIPRIGLLIAFITGISAAIKSGIDDATEENTGPLGWIIAIVIVVILLWALLRSDEEPNYRHSCVPNNIECFMA